MNIDEMTKMLQRRIMEILKIVNSVSTNELDYRLHTQENPDLLHYFCTQKESRLDSSSPPNVPLQHVHNLEPPCTFNCNALNHPKHAKIIATCNTSDIKDCKNKPSIYK